MKKWSIPILLSCLLTTAFCLSMTGRAMAQTPTGEAGLATGTQANGVAGQPPAVPGQWIPGLDRPQGTHSQVQGTPYFYAYIDNNNDRAIRRVSLRWQLQSEFNTDRFILERSNEFNPTHFEPLDEVVALGGDSAGQAYNDLDNAPAGTVSYYRLKIVLKNGDSFYSPVVAVDMNDKNSLTLQPNVLTMGSSTLHMNRSADIREPMTINFFDASGRMTATYLVNSNYFDINTGGWTKGIYFYRITDGHHPLIESGKIMIM